MLKFTEAENNERELLLSLCSEGISGAAAYSYILTHPEIDGSLFFCGRDEAEIKSLVFNDGDEFIRISGNAFPSFLSFDEKCLMVYDSDIFPPIAGQMITGRDILGIYSLLGEGKISFDDERRYVLRLKNVNAGLAAVFGIYDGGRLISTASVGCMNLKYALICDVYTHPDYRGRGAARVLLDSCVSFIISHGRIPFLRCDELMRPYYEKAGFTYYGKM